MRIVLDGCEIRAWREADAPSLARHANDREVWLNLRDAFPHPYGRWSRRVRSRTS